MVTGPQTTIITIIQSILHLHSFLQIQLDLKIIQPHSLCQCFAHFRYGRIARNVEEIIEDVLEARDVDDERPEFTTCIQCEIRVTNTLG